MHLRDRSRSQRLGGEIGEDGGDRPAQVGFDSPPNSCERLGRHVIAQQLELADELLGKDALP